MLTVIFSQHAEILYLFPILFIAILNIIRILLALSLGIFFEVDRGYQTRIYPLIDIYIERDIWVWSIILLGAILTKFFIEKLPILMNQLEKGDLLGDDEKKKLRIFLDNFQKHLHSKLKYILVIILIFAVPLVGRITTLLTPLSQLEISSIEDIRISFVYGIYSFFEKCFLIYAVGQICFIVLLTSICLYKLSKQFKWNINLFKPKGGLTPLADISFLLDLYVFIGGMAIFIWFLVYLPSGFSPYLVQYILFLLLYLSVGSLIFFVPILPLHKIFKSTKKEFLEYLSKELSRNWRVDGSNLLRIKDEVLHVTIFPGTETILKYGMTIGVPLLSMILQMFISIVL